MNEPIRLTQYSHGAGCGCKIAPDVLEKILKSGSDKGAYPRLLVGNDHKDDAAVLDMGNGTALISTTDFFMPIVDDAFDFGRIASVNALSDVYAMGGNPLLAIALLGWPLDKLPPEEAARVLEGARSICREAGIPLAGGHSIDSPEPIFGLAVTGSVSTGNLKTNAGARSGDLLYLTKPLGVGILTTAQKQSKLKEEHLNLARDIMIHLNRIGALFGGLPEVHALTDVTGFGLLGHLREICEASGVSARIRAEAVPVIPESRMYLEMGCVPGGTGRNWNSYQHLIEELTEEQQKLFCDPQTSGGLLVAVDPGFRKEFEQILLGHGYPAEPVGALAPPDDPMIRIV